MSDMARRGTGVTVTLTGPAATEIRRVAANLNVTPQMLIRDLVVKGMASEYRITIK